MPLFQSARAVASDVKARPLRHLVDGELVASAESFDVIDPSTGLSVATCPAASKLQLDQAVGAASSAQAAWSALSFAERRQSLGRMAVLLRDNSEELGALITLEQGKPLAKGVEEVMRAAAMMELIAAIEIAPETVRDDARGRVEIHYRALGVVGVITPWNVPIGLAIPRITHALYTGNTVVLKPSPYTPLATLRMGEVLRSALPPGVLNILAGDDDFGRWMSEHPGIAKISFTGSVPTGKRVMASAAASLKRLTLELGGNDAAIVLDDVDVEAIVPKLFAAAFINSGQVCMSIKRLYVHSSIYERVSEGLARLARASRVGAGFEPGVELGPVQNKAQHEIVKAILLDTRRSDARILAGGQALERPGYFIEPTVVADILEGSRLVDEEPFGPVLPVLRYEDEDDAVRRANDSRFGLAASVWSGSVVRAARLAPRLVAGTTWINHHVGADPSVPFGGVKESGIGREFGKEGLHGYMESMAVFVPAVQS